MLIRSNADLDTYAVWRRAIPVITLKIHTYRHHFNDTHIYTYMHKNVVRTNVGHSFLLLLDKNFPKSNRLLKIFSRNSIEVSYSCMGNVRSAISTHNHPKSSNPNLNVLSKEFVWLKIYRTFQVCMETERLRETSKCQMLYSESCHPSQNLR